VWQAGGRLAPSERRRGEALARAIAAVLWRAAATAAGGGQPTAVLVLRAASAAEVPTLSELPTHPAHLNSS
jgi:hypothetical protein